jgi:hypothetical protein
MAYYTSPQSGDILNSIIIATLIGSINTLFLSQISEILKVVIENFKFWASYIFRMINKNNGEVVLYGMKIVSYDDTHIYFPPSCKAILFKMRQNNINLFSITENSDTILNKGTRYNFQNFNFFVNDSFHHFDIEKDIKVRFKTSSTTINGKDNSSTHYKLSIILFSKKLSVQEITDKISEWLQEYFEIIEKYNFDGKLYCYESIVPRVNNESSKKTVSNWDKNILKSSKTFKNIFFTDKDLLLKKLNFFLNNEAWYIEKGIPYTLGFLFYGEPGCGKTSCIKALANFTKRHILQINLKNIKTCGNFVSIFNDLYVDGTYIPIENRIIVLEDIDCMIDIVKDRNLKNNKEEENKIKENRENILSLLLQQNKKEKYDANDELSLSCILNTIDGIVENHGRILIITTNYINQLDSALIRPGRIDMKVNFTKCTHQMCIDIIEHFYDKKIKKDFVFPELKYSPAELLELCFRNNENIQNSKKEFIDNDELDYIFRESEKMNL